MGVISLFEDESEGSGDGGELFKQHVLTERVQRDVLPHVQTDGAHLQTDTSIIRLCSRRKHTPKELTMNQDTSTAAEVTPLYKHIILLRMTRFFC